MSTTIIITLCVLLLIAYLFDLSASKTKIPSVILLLILGWIVRQVANFFNLNFPDLTEVLSICGTIGLILIVLEGSLELELNKSKLGVVKKSFLGSFASLMAISFIIAWLFHYFSGMPFKTCLANVIPLSIISSAVAIPSAGNLEKKQREFVIYESSLSDILGVLFFNFITLNETIGAASFGQFGIEVLIVLALSFVATLALAFLLSKIEHHIKFVPIILLVILIYAVSKVYHLPGLLFILLFGLFIGNLDELKRFNWIKKLKPEVLNKEVHKFKELNIEVAFLIRALFFLIFGFSMQTSEILNMQTLPWALGIVSIIFLVRAVQLHLSGLPVKPLIFLAPRGLITILLFLSIPVSQAMPEMVNRALVIQVIVIIAFIMMFGLIFNKKEKEETTSIEDTVI